MTEELHATTLAVVRGLTRAQRKMVEIGTASGDFRMDTVRALKAKGLFYVDIDSPNGQCGPLRLTTFGKRIQAHLQQKVAAP